MHKRYIFSNVIGTFVFNEHFNIINSNMFKNIKQYEDREKTEKELVGKYKNITKPEGKELCRILENFKKKEYFKQFYEMNLILTKQKISNAVTGDILIMQAVRSINELDRTINILVKGLREWYALYNPEFTEKEEDHEEFVKFVLLNQKRTTEMGNDFAKKDIEPMINVAKQIDNLYLLRKKQENYLETLMKANCPNMNAVAGSFTGAKLIELAGSLKHLAEIPASTVQLLGAEEALFRHLTRKTKCPKYGVIFSHSYIQTAKKEDQGKRARILADKISIAVKVDYFKGKYIGDKLKKELEEKAK